MQTFISVGSEQRTAQPGIINRYVSNATSNVIGFKVTFIYPRVTNRTDTRPKYIIDVTINIPIEELIDSLISD